MGRGSIPTQFHGFRIPVGGEPRALRRGARDHSPGVDGGALQLPRPLPRGRQPLGRAQAAAASRIRPSGWPCTRPRASPTSATAGCPSTRGPRPRPCRSCASAWRSTARTWPRAGHAWGAEQMALMFPMHVGASGGAAREAMRPGVFTVLPQRRDDLLAAARLLRRAPAAPAGRPGDDGQPALRQVLPRPGDVRRRGRGRRSPAGRARRVRALADHRLVRSGIAMLPRDEVERSMRRFAETVMPKLT